MAGPPTDWTSGERVFAPPSGTLDVDWLVPALLEAVPGVPPERARAALVEAAAGGPRPDGTGAGPPDGLLAAARRVVAEARRTFRA